MLRLFLWDGIMRIVFTCGGTAGHINPAVSIANNIKKLHPDAQILFIGAEGNMEMELVPLEGYDIKGITITNISRGHRLEDIRHNAETLKNVAVSVHDSTNILKEFMPDIVVGTGGYVCYPVITAASRLHIKTAIHESNATPGLTTKLLADHVDSVMVGVENSKNGYRHPEKVLYTGTPVRGDFDLLTRNEAKRELGIDENTPLVVSVWGSLGSGHMNGVMCEIIPALQDGAFRLIHSAGARYYDDVKNTLDASAPDMSLYGIEVRKYIYDMPRIMTAADLVLCRAGASTLAELTYLGKPCIIVPSPNVTNNHQEKNARVLEKAGGAKVMLEGEFTAQDILSSIKELISDSAKLEEMSSAMRGLSVPNAVELITGNILRLIK